MKAILVLNSGSSSLKFAVYPIEPELAAQPTVLGQADGIGANPVLKIKQADGRTFEQPIVTSEKSTTAQHKAALADLMAWLEKQDQAPELAAVGHRIVHGGTRFYRPMLLDKAVVEELHTLTPLAPLHQPHNLRAVEAIFALSPQLPQIGCFDTAFHHTQPDIVRLYGLPRKYTEQGIQRYGFHGLSYDYVSRQLPEVFGDRIANGAVIVAHLGNGSSLCGMRDLKSICTTLGFTTVEGLVMGTRTGTLDPGILLYLMDQEKMDYNSLTNLIYKESGLLGVSGISQDMRELLASDKAEAKEAVELYCYRIAREIGSAAAAIEGLDALVFTAGIGAKAVPVRRRVAELSKWIGVEIDAQANEAHAIRIDAPQSRVAVAVIPTDEELMIARYTHDLLEPEKQ